MYNMPITFVATYKYQLKMSETQNKRSVVK